MIFPERKGNFIQGLYDMIKYIGNTKNMSIIEIGTWTGCSTEIFCKNFKSVITIDPFDNNVDWFSKKYDMQKVYEFAVQRLSKYGNIEIIRDYSYNIKDRYADIVYIDGSHEYPNIKRDAIAYTDHAKLFIAGHDYHKKFPGVIRAVSEIFGKPEKVFKDTSWIFRKRECA